MDVIQERQADTESLLLCPRRTIPLLRPENRIEACRDCGDDIQVHPTSPPKPRKVCPDCCSIRTLRGPDFTLSATTKQVAFADRISKKG